MAVTTESKRGQITVRGARTHNLKNVDLTLPARSLIVMTGVSGSGKSSLAFDTIYAEGQRRYVESLSAYARQFLERMEKPDVDSIEGICPAIAIRQKNSIRNPRSTVGTTTEIHDYLRLLYARVGRTFCRQCGREVIRETAEIVARRLGELPAGTRLLIGFDMPVVAPPPMTREPDSEPDEDGAPPENGDDPPVPQLELPDLVDPVAETVATLRRKGFGRLYIDGRTVTLEDSDLGILKDRPALQVIVDRLRIEGDLRARLTDSIETAYTEGGGAAFAIQLTSETRGAERGEGVPASDEPGGVQGAPPSNIVHRFSERFECRVCEIPYEVPQPRLFSFNNPFGACPVCHGFGNIIELDMNLVVPDPSKSIQQNAIEPWSKPHYRPQLADLKRAAKVGRVRLDVPWSALTEEERRFVVDGDPSAGSGQAHSAGSGQAGTYEGVKGFFRWLERKKYKVHVRVFLSRYRGYLTCPDCAGARLRREARDVQVGGRTIDVVSALTVRDAESFFAGLELTEKEAAIADKVLREIRKRLGFLRDVGLEYLTLDRLSSTLSGGESQRINLATSLGSALVDTLYVLDEPSIGLHSRDNGRLIAILRQLRDQGNTVLVVEHDADMIKVADTVVDMGLGAGEQGGRVIYSGPLAGLLNEPRSLTAKYLRDELAIPVPAVRRKPTNQRLKILGAREHNLKGVDIEIPLGVLTCVTGVSGSGKSTLVHDVIYAALKKSKGDWDRRVGTHRRLEGAELVSDVVLVDQAPIGRTPRSNPVTYLKAFDPIRELFAATKDARSRGLSASAFSFNVPGGRCEACEGEGEVKVEMQFLADVFVPCDQCEGKRFKSQVLEVKYRGRGIDQVLDMTVREALTFFSSSPKVLRRLQVLDEIGLGYLRLGQPATTLSGGEAQRIKIAAHLSSHTGDRILYILDEPTTGLHFDDIAKLLAAFRKLLQAGHSLLVIEHNLDVIKTADWVVDLGPEGGEEGGELVAAGTPEQIVKVPQSHTGKYLGEVLAVGRSNAYGTGRVQ
ncbi:MAG: excinuclease ABC subunit A [Acidobacteria bacterium RIFCSPLOWO2_02_FULL_67_36]|nr:MAG: excinuclease ABC subunit A [Acidobacteria bacterium RIFCSPLOWO2_02_FULL_67_36]OFW19769.1 MAG: excinuclease ABC subunit A [Acidobacteria bacterium RIFCSPLOWO2_12_FULL_66_21]